MNPNQPKPFKGRMSMTAHGSRSRQNRQTKSISSILDARTSLNNRKQSYKLSKLEEAVLNLKQETNDMNINPNHSVAIEDFNKNQPLDSSLILNSKSSTFMKNRKLMHNSKSSLNHRSQTPSDNRFLKMAVDINKTYKQQSF